MKIKIRPYGLVNLLHLFVTIVFIVISLFLPLYSLFYRSYSLLYFISLIFVYPLFIHFLQAYKRCIVVAGDKIIFQIDTESKSILRLPKYFQDEFSLSELKYYGIFTGAYVQGYEKKERTKKSDKKDDDLKYDVLFVKEGKLKIPHGLINIGSPLAFVFQKEQYIIDDYLFTPEQYARLFAIIENNCQVTASGAVKAGSLQETSSGLLYSLLDLLTLILAICLPFLLRYLLANFTSLPIDLSQFNSLDSAILAFLVIANVAMTLKFIYRSLKKRKPLNFEAYDVMEFVAGISSGLFYLLTAVCILFGYIL